jgi:hypothetical protein
MRKFESKSEKKRARTPLELLYYGAGIPSRVWSKPNFNIKFNPIMGREEDSSIKVSPQTQEEWFPTLTAGELLEDPYLIYLSSVGSDELGCRVAYELMKTALQKDVRVQITNAARIDKEETDEETVFMLHNVYGDANNYRMQSIRDWITIHDDCFRIVVIAGMCPYEFSKRVHMEPHAMFLIDTATNKVKISRA